MDFSVARQVPRLSWINGRLVLGVLLLSVAFVAGQRLLAESARTTGVWAAARDLARGSRLDAGDLELAQVKLPAEVLGRYLPAGRKPEGATLGRSLRAGELIPAQSVASERALASTRSITIPVAPEHAVGGALRPGDRVDVFATFGQGEGNARTRLLVADVEIAEVLSGGGLVSGEESLVGVTVSVTPQQAARLAYAIRSGEIDLARLDGAVQVPGHGRGSRETHVS